MSVNKPVVDRVPTYPGRVRMLPVSGQANTYDMVRADSPVVEGTPINKELLDQKAYTLTKAVTLYVSTGGNDTTGNGTSAAPYKTINKALSTIPKNLGGFSATVNIAAGTYDEVFNVNYFHGGNIVFAGTGTATLGGISVSDSRVVVERPLAFNSAGGTAINLVRGAFLLVNQPVVVNAAATGVYAQTGAVAIFNDGLEANNCTTAALRITTAANVYVSAITGRSNVLGLSVDSSAAVSYGASSIAATAATRTASGGRILSGSQAEIPSY